MKLNISEAARRAGVKRQILYRKMQNGSLSKEINEDGHPVIDLSELCRLYPDAANYDGHANNVTKQSIGQFVTDDGQKEIFLLKERIVALEADKLALRGDLDHERSDRDRLLALVERHAETVRLLTDQRTQAASAEPQKRSFWQRLTGQSGHPAKQGLA